MINQKMSLLRNSIRAHVFTQRIIFHETMLLKTPSLAHKAMFMTRFCSNNQNKKKVLQTTEKSESWREHLMWAPNYERINTTFLNLPTIKKKCSFRTMIGLSSTFRWFYKLVSSVLDSEQFEKIVSISYMLHRSPNFFELKKLQNVFLSTVLRIKVPKSRVLCSFTFWIVLSPLKFPGADEYRKSGC